MIPKAMYTEEGSARTKVFLSSEGNKIICNFSDASPGSVSMFYTPNEIRTLIDWLNEAYDYATK